MSVYGGYTVFFTLRKKDGYELKKTLTNQRITHAKSHVSNTVVTFVFLTGFVFFNLIFF